MQRTKWFTSEAADSSVALFAAMHALEIAEAQLQHAVTEANEANEAKEASKHNECLKPEHVVANLLYAARVAHAACETALTRVEPMYEDNVHGTEEEHGLCYEMVNTALTNARTVCVCARIREHAIRWLVNVTVCVSPIATDAVGRRNACVGAEQ
jgi:hypothetical protein